MTEANAPAYSVIEEPKGCFACGKETRGYTVCEDCGADMFIQGFSSKDINGYMDYVRAVNPERYGMIKKWCESQVPNSKKLIHQNLNHEKQSPE